MQYVTAGESHGPKLTAIVSGVPSGLKLTEMVIESDLRRRQSGYGRGGRQKIETDRAVITSGVRFGKTTGSPIALEVKNKDWENWTEKMAHFGTRKSDCSREVTPRPGHADLVGILKTDQDDCRNILERASARETAARVAAGSIAREFLGELGVEVFSWVNSIGDVFYDDSFIYEVTENDISDELRAMIEFSAVRCPDERASQLICEKIDDAKDRGETLGGTFRVVATGLLPGLGGYSEASERLTSKLAASIYSIPAIKGLEFGAGFEGVSHFGSEFHDEIELEDGKFVRTTNRAGGLEGGMTNGCPLLISAAMKPIPTCMNPLKTVNIDTLESASSFKERSDVCAVPACAVVAEAEVCMVLANAYCEMFGSNCMSDITSNIQAYKNRLDRFAK